MCYVSRTRLRKGQYPLVSAWPGGCGKWPPPGGPGGPSAQPRHRRHHWGGGMPGWPAMARLGGRVRLGPGPGVRRWWRVATGDPLACRAAFRLGAIASSGVSGRRHFGRRLTGRWPFWVALFRPGGRGRMNIGFRWIMAGHG